MFEFYCRYGNVDKDGSHTGLFRRTAAVRDNSQLDISWEDFQSGQLTPTLAAQDSARTNANRDERVNAVDMYMHGLPEQ